MWVFSSHIWGARSHAGAYERCVRTLSPLQGSFVPTLERVDDACVLSPLQGSFVPTLERVDDVCVLSPYLWKTPQMWGLVHQKLAITW